MVLVLLVILILSYIGLFQYVSEKIGGAKGTELDEDLVDMEKVSFVGIFLLTFQQAQPTSIAPCVRLPH
jgi:hypothetical protein